MPNSQEASDPVHAPVTGKGTATNNTKAILPQISYLRENLFRVLPNSQMKNLSIIPSLPVSFLYIGFKEYMIIAEMIISANADQKIAAGADILYTPKAIGIETLSSATGIKAISITAISGRKFLNSSM